MVNEPKKRGRPPKAKVVQMTPEPAEQIGAMQAEVVNTWATERAQDYALRVWSGQSPDVPRNERLRRVAKALEGQGMSMEGVEL